MLLRLFPVVILLFSKSLFAYESPIEIIEYIDNVKVVAFISKADIKDTPAWSPFKSKPPLSIEKALNKVKLFLHKNDLQNITMHEIELKRVPHHNESWHYLVKLSYKLNSEVHNHYFVVLMSGKVIAALKEPESIK
ncbi:MAG TPA: hypothetical protein ENJ28_02305 [Gammaproteobacteria bacterium]|nr:hypothetical protein [Gammaproteobacteria bacterium]